MLAGKTRRALDRQIVGFGGARREYYLAGIGTDQRGDFAARLLDRLGGNPTVRMARAVRIAELLGEIGQHRVEYAGVEPVGGLMVEIDRQAVGRSRFPDREQRCGGRGHAARALGARPRQRRKSAGQASRKWAISASDAGPPRPI